MVAGLLGAAASRFWSWLLWLLPEFALLLPPFFSEYVSQGRTGYFRSWSTRISWLACLWVRPADQGLFWVSLGTILPFLLLESIILEQAYRYAVWPALEIRTPGRIRKFSSRKRFSRTNAALGNLGRRCKHGGRFRLHGFEPPILLMSRRRLTFCWTALGADCPWERRTCCRRMLFQSTEL